MPGSRTIAIGDIHGEVSLVRRLIETIQPQAEDTIVGIGDYLDRGEDSIATIIYLLELDTHYHCIWLRGNHDAAWLEVWNGERFTHVPAIPGARKVWAKYRFTPPAFIGTFLEKTRIFYEDGYAWYSHAGALPGVPFWETPPEVFVWGRSGFLSSSWDWGKPVIFGHYEVSEPVITPTQIGIDTAAYRSGILTAIIMPERRIVQVTRAMS
jgi:serine/threonine protein phosphatase 1